MSCCSEPEPSWPFQGGVGRPSNQCCPWGTPVALGTPGCGVELHNKGRGQRKGAWAGGCSETKEVGNYSTKLGEVFVSGVTIQVLCLEWKGLEYKFIQKNGDHNDCKKAGGIFDDLGTTERGRFLFSSRWGSTGHTYISGSQCWWSVRVHFRVLLLL